MVHPHDQAGHRSRRGDRGESRAARRSRALILLDTNVLSELAKPRPDPQVVAWARRSAAALMVPTIAVAEMAYGIEKLARGRRREDLLRALRRLVVEFADRLLDFNVDAAWAYGRILAGARSAGRPMAVPDAAIAAIAQVNGCALATRNVKDFTTTGLEVVDPWHGNA
ncbi:MAG TPA: type II toxin-antitoxin system VapC family toxin [Geminicoccaceae bacterium]|nr:type II toxin-antitoxin system VapC family toxin [Geminicoccaceae bacterium]